MKSYIYVICVSNETYDERQDFFIQEEAYKSYQEAIKELSQARKRWEKESTWVGRLMKKILPT